MAAVDGGKGSDGSKDYYIVGLVSLCFDGSICSFYHRINSYYPSIALLHHVLEQRVTGFPQPQ